VGGVDKHFLNHSVHEHHKAAGCAVRICVVANFVRANKNSSAAALSKRAKGFKLSCARVIAGSTPAWVSGAFGPDYRRRMDHQTTHYHQIDPAQLGGYYVTFDFREGIKILIFWGFFMCETQITKNQQNSVSAHSPPKAECADPT
jgi:hypothetical protein